MLRLLDVIGLVGGTVGEIGIGEEGGDIRGLGMVPGGAELSVLADIGVRTGERATGWLLLSSKQSDQFLERRTVKLQF